MQTLRSQSAMEYLMTYGWAIIIIVVVLAALFYLGVFNTTSFQGTFCLANVGYYCQQPTLYSNGIVAVRFGESGGTYTISGIACTNATSSASPVISSSTLPGGSATLFSESIVTLNFSCPLPSNVIGTPFTGRLWVSYTNQYGQSITEQAGTVSVKVTAIGASAVQYVWIANFNSGTVSKITTSGALVATYHVSGAPESMAIDSNGNLWIANTGGSNVIELSTSTGNIMGSYNVGSVPVGITIDPSGNVWVANYGNGGGSTVSELYGNNGVTKGTYTVGSSNYPYQITADTTGNVYVTYGAYGVAKLSSTGTVLWSESISSCGGVNPNYIAIDSVGNVFVTSGNQRISEYSSTGTGPICHDTSSTPNFAIFDSSGNLWVTAGTLLDLTDPAMSQTNSISVGSSPVGIAFQSNGNMWVTNSGSDSVTELTPGGTVIATYSSGLSLNEPYGIIIH